MNFEDAIRLLKEGNTITIDGFADGKVRSTDGTLHSIESLDIDDTGAGNFIRQASLLKTDAARNYDLQINVYTTIEKFQKSQ